MKTLHLLAAVAAPAVFVAGLAAAQPVNPSPTASPPIAAPAPTGQAVTTSSVTTTKPSGATMTVSTTTNGPVPDTVQNRKKYGGPMSHAGKRTAPAGN